VDGVPGDADAEAPCMDCAANLRQDVAAVDGWQLSSGIRQEDDTRAVQLKRAPPVYGIEFVDRAKEWPLAVQAKGGLAGIIGGTHEIARQGIRGTGQPMPHREAIQRAFGHHDVSHIRAHIGGAATVANAGMGAIAYAFGSNVAFAKSPDLHTAAHEAAHVIQQAGGVQLKDGVGRPGDRYERHADAVADRVVAGRSAESLLGADVRQLSATTAVQMQETTGTSSGVTAPPVVNIIAHNGAPLRRRFVAKDDTADGYAHSIANADEPNTEKEDDAHWILEPRGNGDFAIKNKVDKCYFEEWYFEHNCWAQSSGNRTDYYMMASPTSAELTEWHIQPVDGEKNGPLDGEEEVYLVSKTSQRYLTRTVDSCYSTEKPQLSFTQSEVSPNGDGTSKWKIKRATEVFRFHIEDQEYDVEFTRAGAGDTFGSIAKQTGHSFKDLLRVNPASIPATPYEGNADETLRVKHGRKIVLSSPTVIGQLFQDVKGIPHELEEVICSELDRFQSLVSDGLDNATLGILKDQLDRVGTSGWATFAAVIAGGTVWVLSALLSGPLLPLGIMLGAIGMLTQAVPSWPVSGVDARVDPVALKKRAEKVLSLFLRKIKDEALRPYIVSYLINDDINGGKDNALGSFLRWSFPNFLITSEASGRVTLDDELVRTYYERTAIELFNWVKAMINLINTPHAAPFPYGPYFPNRSIARAPDIVPPDHAEKLAKNLGLTAAGRDSWRTP
jgi:hypothetical protein